MAVSETTVGGAGLGLLLLGDGRLDRREAELRSRQRLPLHGASAVEALLDREQRAVAGQFQRSAVGLVRHPLRRLAQQPTLLGSLVAVQIPRRVPLGLEILGG